MRHKRDVQRFARGYFTLRRRTYFPIRIMRVYHCRARTRNVKIHQRGHVAVAEHHVVCSCFRAIGRMRAVANGIERMAHFVCKGIGIKVVIGKGEILLHVLRLPNLRNKLALAAVFDV